MKFTAEQMLNAGKAAFEQALIDRAVFPEDGAAWEQQSVERRAKWLNIARAAVGSLGFRVTRSGDAVLFAVPLKGGL